MFQTSALIVFISKIQTQGLLRLNALQWRLTSGDAFPTLQIRQKNQDPASLIQPHPAGRESRGRTPDPISTTVQRIGRGKMTQLRPRSIKYPSIFQTQVAPAFSRLHEWKPGVFQVPTKQGNHDAPSLFWWFEYTNRFET